jgi:hypothetical protein
MTSGEGKKFWRRFDAISPESYFGAAEFQVAPAVAIAKPQLGPRVHAGSSTRMPAASIRAR